MAEPGENLDEEISFACTMTYNKDEVSAIDIIPSTLDGTADHILEQIPSEHENSSLRYKINERPPFLLTLILAFQNVVLSFGMNLLVSFTVADLACADRNDPIRAQLFCSSVFVVGLTTVVQCAVGIRLPVFQGVSAAFIGPLLSMKTSGIWTCENEIVMKNISGSSSSNMTTTENVSMASDMDTSITDRNLVLYRITQLQGSLMLSGLATEVLLGGTGLLGYIVTFVGPIPISVTIVSVGLSLYPVPIYYVSSYLPVGICGVVVMAFSVTYLAGIYIHLPAADLRHCQKRKVTKKENKSRDKVPIFLTFAVLITVVITWVLCWILTETGVLADDPNLPSYRARTDTRGQLLTLSPWLTFPYPGQFGPPRFHPAIFIVFIASYVSSNIESVGDYMMISRVTGSYPPPRHAINRGILVEGLGGILAGAIGTGHATTSYSENIILIQLTAVASRSVLIVAGMVCMLFGLFGKFGALVAAIPDPVVGGVFVVSMGMLVSVGLSPLQRVNLSSTRNLAVIGISLYVGLVFAEWMKIHQDNINTGNSSADQVLRMIFGTQMFVAGVTAVVLDNSVKGSKEERGIAVISSFDKATENGISLPQHNRVYDVPGVNKLQQNVSLFRHIPFLQTYEQRKRNDQ